MSPRDTAESHRVATPLELLFDLCFVVAVANAAAGLHHAIAENHAVQGVLSFAAVFFAIWWAWMNFTWFASAYDIDDVPYRIAALVQIGGNLVLAAGIPRAFEEQNFTLAVTGYTIMRAGLVTQWIRAGRAHRECRATAYRYAAGLVAVQSIWIGWLFLPESWRMPLFAAFALIDLAVPVWAERRGATPWHPHHIAERYGLFTIIVLGESILAASMAIQSALDDDARFRDLATLVAGGLLIVFSMWWLYFAKPAHRFLTATQAASFIWGYGHLLVFGSAAAVGAGLAVGVDETVGHAHLGTAAAGAAVTVPVALFLLVLWFLQVRPHHVDLLHSALFPVAAALVLAVTFTPWPVLATGLCMAVLVAVGVLLRSRGSTSR